MTPQGAPTCPRGHGLLAYDDDHAAAQDSGRAPSLWCPICGHRLHLNDQGKPLAVQGPTDRGNTIETQVLLMHSQGYTTHQIYRRLRCGLKLVRLVLAERNERAS